MTRASVIVPTLQRCGLLALCLESLTRQTLPPDDFEVIVVDNGSTDDTAGVVQRYSDRLQICRVYEPEPGLHAARHAGYRAARSDLLLYVDDDVEAEPGWAEAVVRGFADPQVGLVGGNNLPRFEVSPPGWLGLWWSTPVLRGRALGYLSILDFGSGRFEVDPHYVWGCNFSVRRQVLEAAGGFHPDSLPHDLIRLRGDGETYVAHTVRRLGQVALFDSAATVRHFVPASRMTAQYLTRRAYAQGISDSFTAIRRRGKPDPQWSCALSLRLRHGVNALREHLKWLTDRGVTSRDLLDVRLATHRAWRDGYVFHQAAVRYDDDLLAWVLRPSYLR